MHHSQINDWKGLHFSPFCTFIRIPPERTANALQFTYFDCFDAVYFQYVPIGFHSLHSSSEYHFLVRMRCRRKPFTCSLFNEVMFISRIDFRGSFTLCNQQLKSQFWKCHRNGTHVFTETWQLRGVKASTLITLFELRGQMDEFEYIPDWTSRLPANPKVLFIWNGWTVWPTCVIFDSFWEDIFALHIWYWGLDDNHETS